MGGFAIPLSIKQPEFATPADILKQRLGIQQLANSTQLQRQAMQENELKMREQQEDRQDDQTFGDLMVKHKGDFEKARAEAITSGVRTRNVQRHDQDYLTHQRQVSALKLEDKNNYNLENQMKGDALTALYEMPYEQRAKALPKFLEGLGKAGIDVSQFADLDPTNENLDPLITSVGYHQHLLDWDKRTQEAERNKQVAARAEADAKVKTDKDAADEKQRKLAAAATSYLKVKDQAGHDKWLEKLPDDIKPEFEDLTEFSPETKRVVQDMALTPVERSRRDTAQTRIENRRHSDTEIAIQRARDELGEDADPADVEALGMKYRAEMVKDAKVVPAGRGGGKPGAQKDDRGFTPVQVKTDQTKHEQLQTQENAQWRLAQDYADALKRADGEQVTDPGSRSSGVKPLDGNIRKDFQRKLDDARHKAEDFQRQKMTIRQIHGWDEAGGAQSPAAKPAATATTPAIDPSIKKMGDYEVGKEYETKGGRKIKIKGFTKDGKVIPE